jgi:diacylglycerol kinase (ATP)
MKFLGIDDLPSVRLAKTARTGMGMWQWLAGELSRIGNTCRWSWQGVRSAWAREKSFRQWTLVNIASAALAFALALTLGLLVLVMELVNTAIEETVDYISEAHDPRAGRAKDAGSAAVAMAAIAGGVAWLVILIG